MGGVRQPGTAAQIVHEVELGAGVGRVAGQQQVTLVRSAGAQVLGQRAARVVGRLRGRQLVPADRAGTRLSRRTRLGNQIGSAR